MTTESVEKPEDISDREKLIVDVLFKEFQRIQAKSVATDDWFFRFLSIAVIPFFAFLGYCAVTPAYRILVSALPVLSIVGLMVVSVLTSHYLFVGVYAEFLERQINLYVGEDVMHDSRFGTAAYTRFTPVTVSYGLGIAMLVVINVIAVPFINREVIRFAKVHPNLLPDKQTATYYWWSVGAFLTITLITAIWSFFATRHRLTHIASTSGTTERRVTNDAGSA